MITALREGEIDIGIGLTEGWIAGLGKEDVQGDGGYRLVGTYVETPLCKSQTSISSCRRGRVIKSKPCDNEKYNVTTSH